MKHAVSTLEGALLDAAVAKACGYEFGIELAREPTDIDHGAAYTWTRGGPQSSNAWTVETFNPSTDWSIGGPIIEREHIGLFFVDPCRTTCAARIDSGQTYIGRDPSPTASGPTPLIAAMRTYVLKTFGGEIEL